MPDEKYKKLARELHNCADRHDGWPCDGCRKIALALERVALEGKIEEMDNIKAVFVSRNTLPDWWNKHEQFLRKRLEELGK